jgi:hypothetical protein
MTALRTDVLKSPSPNQRLEKAALKFKSPGRITRFPVNKLVNWMGCMKNGRLTGGQIVGVSWSKNCAKYGVP